MMVVQRSTCAHLFNQRIHHDFPVCQIIISHLISFKSIDLYTSIHFLSPVGLNTGCHERYTAYQIFEIEVHVNPTQHTVHSEPNNVRLWTANQVSRDLMTLHMNSTHSIGIHSVDKSETYQHQQLQQSWAKHCSPLHWELLPSLVPASKYHPYESFIFELSK